MPISREPSSTSVAPSCRGRPIAHGIDQLPIPVDLHVDSAEAMAHSHPNPGREVLIPVETFKSLQEIGAGFEEPAMPLFEQSDALIGGQIVNESQCQIDAAPLCWRASQRLAQQVQQGGLPVESNAIDIAGTIVLRLFDGCFLDQSLLLQFGQRMVDRPVAYLRPAFYP